MKHRKKGVILRSPAIALVLAFMTSLFPFQHEAQVWDATGAVIGSPALAFFSPNELKTTFGAEFVKMPCDLISEGQDRVNNILSYGKLKQLVIALDYADASSEYDAEEPENPSNVERVGDMKVYAADYGDMFKPLDKTYHLDKVKELGETVTAIKAICAEKDVQVTIILMPLHSSRLNSIDYEDMKSYKRTLTDIGGFWDFSMSTLSGDMRFFHTRDRARVSLCSMILNKIAGRDFYVAPDFGTYLIKRKLSEQFRALKDFEYPETDAAYAVDVPVLLYHNITENPITRADISPETFRSHMEAIKKAGYNTVTAKQMVAYVHYGVPLPENPIFVTIDDGYLSNYQLAYPIIKELGLKATIFAIGNSVGHTYYKNTTIPITPHFSYEQAKEMMDSGCIEVQSHTYDLHQWGPYEEPGTRLGARQTALQKEDEPDSEYISTLRRDFNKYTADSKYHFYAMAYPQGQYNELAEQVIHDLGVSMTVSTTTDRRNVLIKGVPQSLYALCRYDIPEGMTPDQLLKLIAK